MLNLAEEIQSKPGASHIGPLELSSFVQLAPLQKGFSRDKSSFKSLPLLPINWQLQRNGPSGDKPLAMSHEQDVAALQQQLQLQLALNAELLRAKDESLASLSNQLTREKILSQEKAAEAAKAQVALKSLNAELAEARKDAQTRHGSRSRERSVCGLCAATFGAWALGIRCSYQQELERTLPAVLQEHGGCSRCW
jgi:hypothetical protein